MNLSAVDVCLSKHVSTTLTLSSFSKAAQTTGGRLVSNSNVQSAKQSSKAWYKTIHFSIANLESGRGGPTVDHTLSTCFRLHAISYWKRYAKIHTFSTCACAKETTFFTISTSWWTLNCLSFSSSSYGYWDMHHFICQLCHTDCMLKVLKFIHFQLARVRMKQHFSQSLPRGELWTVRRLALAHTVTEICTTSFVNFVILIVCWRC